MGGQGNGQGSVAVTSSDSADPGAMRGFSITASESRDWNGSAWGQATENLKFAIKGGAAGIRPGINQVRVVSVPTHDADGDGINDTFIEGDEILVDVWFRSGEAVKVDHQGRQRQRRAAREPGGSTKKFAFDRVVHGDETVRFAYTVEGGNGEACNLATTTADCDTDGIEPGTGTVGIVANVLVELSNGATVKGADAGVNADPRYTGGFSQGVAARLKVDGSIAAADSTAGPRATTGGDPRRFGRQDPGRDLRQAARTV